MAKGLLGFIENFFAKQKKDVAKLRPRLHGHLHIHRHRYRGQGWYVIQDAMSGRFHRFSADA